MLPPKLILVQIDFSDLSRAALDVATNMASRLGAELLLVHVVPSIPDIPNGASIFKEGQYDRSVNEKADQELKGLASSLAKKSVKARAELSAGNDVGMELIRIAERDHADMIVIATHGTTGWPKISFGSIAEKVMKESKFPVLVLRAKGATSACERREHDARLPCFVLEKPVPCGA